MVETKNTGTGNWWPSLARLRSGFRYDVPSGEGNADAGDAGGDSIVGEGDETAIADSFRALHEKISTDAADAGGETGKAESKEGAPEPEDAADGDEDESDDADTGEQEADDAKQEEKSGDEKDRDEKVEPEPETAEIPKVLAAEEVELEVKAQCDAVLQPHVPQIQELNSKVASAEAALKAISEELDAKENDGDVLTRADQRREKDAEEALKSAKAAEEKFWSRIEPKLEEAKDSVLAGQVDAKLNAAKARHPQLAGVSVDELRSLYKDGLFSKDPDEMLALVNVRRSKSGKKAAVPTPPSAEEVQRKVAAQHEKERRAGRITQGRSGGSRSTTKGADGGKVIDFTSGMSAAEKLQFQKFEQVQSRVVNG